jgi:hypothetical protein
MEEKYLPIGTVVMLKGGRKELMITGYLVSEEGKQEVYDYSGCLYPEGIISSNQNAVFNHDQIQEILFKGFDSDKFKEFHNKLKTLV